MEVTVRISRLPVSLSAVRIRAERDDIRARPFLGMNFRAMGAQIITPSELAAFRGGERDYLDLLQWVLPPAFAVRTLDADFVEAQVRATCRALGAPYEHPPAV